MAAKKINKNMKFEEALAELEAAVEKLESGDLPLEEAIEEFQKGTELSRICMEKLKVAKAAVQKLVVSPVNDDNFALASHFHVLCKNHLAITQSTTGGTDGLSAILRHPQKAG